MCRAEFFAGRLEQSRPQLFGGLRYGQRHGPGEGRLDPERAGRERADGRANGRFEHGFVRDRPDAHALQSNAGNPGGLAPESPDGRLFGDPRAVVRPSEGQQSPQAEPTAH